MSCCVFVTQGGLFGSLLCAARSGEWHPTAQNPPDDSSAQELASLALESHPSHYHRAQSSVPLGQVPRSSLAAAPPHYVTSTARAGALPPHRDGGGDKGRGSNGGGTGGVQVWDITDNPSDNIFLMKRVTDDDDFQWRYINGTCDYMGRKQGFQSSGNFSGYKVYMTMDHKSLQVLDNTKMLKVVPYNVKTGAPYGG